jgi:hypothetical protein
MVPVLFRVVGAAPKCFLSGVDKLRVRDMQKPSVQDAEQGVQSAFQRWCDSRQTVVLPFPQALPTKTPCHCSAGPNPYHINS